MNSESVITDRGQVTLPKFLRDRLGLLPGMRVRFVPQKTGLVIRKTSKGSDVIRNLFGVVRDKVATDRYLRQIRGKGP